MKRYFLSIAALTMLLGCAFAAAPTVPTVHVAHAWIRWLPENLPAAGYMVIENDGDKAVRLIGAESPDYASVMLHRSQPINGMDNMSMIASIEVPAHGQVALAPGGYHLMLSGARHTIKPGDQVSLTLHFADGQSLQTDFPVRPANASGP